MAARPVILAIAASLLMVAAALVWTRARPRSNPQGLTALNPSLPAASAPAVEPPPLLPPPQPNTVPAPRPLAGGARQPQPYAGVPVQGAPARTPPTPAMPGAVVTQAIPRGGPVMPPQGDASTPPGFTGRPLPPANPGLPPQGVASTPPGFTESPSDAAGSVVAVLYMEPNDILTLLLSGPREYRLDVGAFQERSIEVQPGYYEVFLSSLQASGPRTGAGLFRAHRRYSTAVVLRLRDPYWDPGPFLMGELDPVNTPSWGQRP